jgi:hypothetical protein
MFGTGVVEKISEVLTVVGGRGREDYIYMFPYFA